jgi:hypothetical protein
MANVNDCDLIEEQVEAEQDMDRAEPDALSVILLAGVLLAVLLADALFVLNETEQLMSLIRLLLLLALRTIPPH